VQQIAETTLSGFLTSGWTTCYTGNVVAVTGWNTYNFTTTFNWDGTSSLVFKVCFNNSAWNGNSLVYYTSTPPSGVHNYWFNDLETSSGCDQTAASGSTFRPNVQITGQPNSSPLLSVNPASLDFGFIFASNTSEELTYLLSGSNLNPAGGNITITPPSNFSVSLTSGGPYSSVPVNVAYSGGTLAATPVYVVFMPTQYNTSYYGNIANSGGGATDVYVAVTGSSSCDSYGLPHCQYFPDDTIPGCWHQTFSGSISTERWSIVTSSIAGGAANEAVCTWTTGNGTSRLISPPFIITGNSSIHLAFRHMFDDYNIGADVMIMLQCRFNSGAWDTLWSHAGGIGSNIPAELMEIDIPVEDLVVEFAWTVVGNHYSFDYWYIDDICISGQLLHDVRTVSIDNIPAIFDPGTTIIPKATVKNSGGTSPETFDVTMTITGGYSSTVTGVSLNSGTQTQVTFSDWTPTVGSYSVEVCTGLSEDMDTTNDCKSKTVSVKYATKMYCYVASAGSSGLPEGPAYFYDNAPGVIVSLDTTASENFISAGTWADGIWYGSEYWDGSTGGGWWTMDPVTGAMTKIADLEKSFTGITYDLTTDVLYAVEYNGLSNNLYTIEAATGDTALLGTIGSGELLINLATDGTGYIYSIGVGTDHLFKINPSGPTMTDVGPCGVDMNFAQDMEYDHSGNTMYAAAYSGIGGLYSVNLGTGACTLLGSFQGGAEITGFAVPYCIENNQWTGNVSNEWENSGNWTCGEIPDEFYRVFVPSNPSGGRFPVVSSGVNAECYDIIIANGADVFIQNGGTLNVKNP
jgi:hypothetical protein